MPGSFFTARNTPSLRTSSRIAWALQCALIAYGSSGTWSAYEPGLWAPTLVSLRDVAINILLYVPFGVFGFLSLRDSDREQRFGLVTRLIWLAVLFSVLNEGYQLFTTDRVASLTDVLSAAAGTFAGATAAGAWLDPR